MFRHLLVPIDGSPLSDEAVKKTVSFAKCRLLFPMNPTKRLLRLRNRVAAI